MTVHAYLRVSTDQQDVDAQRHGIREYAEGRRLIVDEWTEDAVSGKKPWRERKLGALIERLQSGDTLLVAEVSRVARSTLQCLEVFQACADRGASVFVAKQRMEMDGSMSARITSTVLALAAEIERDLISQRTKEGLAARRAAGVRLGRPTGPAARLKLDDRTTEIRDLLAKGVARAEIARLMRVGRTTLYRWLERDAERQAEAARRAAEAAPRTRKRRAAEAAPARDAHTVDWVSDSAPAAGA